MINSPFITPVHHDRVPVQPVLPALLQGAFDVTLDAKLEAKLEAVRDMSLEAALEPAHEPAREPAREAAREAAHEPAREPAHEPACDPAREAPREMPRELPREASRHGGNLQRLPQLARLHAMTPGLQAMRIGLIDGWVDVDHEAFRNARLFQDPRDAAGECAIAPPSAQATFTASLLVGGAGLGLCSGCTLLSLPVADGPYQSGRLAPALRAQRVAQAIRRGVDWGAHVLVLGAAAVPFTAVLEQACEGAARAGVRIVALTDVHHQAPRRAWVAVTPGEGAGHGGDVGTRIDALRVPVVELLGAALPAGNVALRVANCALTMVTASFVLLAALRRDLSGAEIWSALLGAQDVLRGPSVLDVSAALLHLAGAGQPDAAAVRQAPDHARPQPRNNRYAGCWLSSSKG